MQSLLDLVYPHQCVMCDHLVEDAHGLCGACWRDTPFILGLCCDLCGAPLPGDPGEIAHCDDCMTLARPWQRGRAALIYRDGGRKLVLALKHGDRLDIVPPAAAWMARAAAPLLRPGQVVVPVPAHWSRRIARRYNQAALLALQLAKGADLGALPRALVRTRRTGLQDGKSVEARFRNLSDAIRPHPKLGAALDGAEVLLVDDVMTSGATLAAAAEACRAAGAVRIDTLTLARVVKES